ncbi:hypothetical protein JCM10213_009123 [Rhodosporidiobolus nylandii]
MRVPLVAFAALLPIALAQTSTSSDFASSSSDSTTTLTSTSTSTLTNTVVQTRGSSSTTSTSKGPAPTANSTAATANSGLELWLTGGELRMCEMATFAFTGPAVPKTCGVFVTNTSTYLQQIPLGGTFTSLTAGTFQWLVDVPAGLSLEVQLWVTINGGVSQYTLHDLVVQEGQNNSCLATGPGQNTASIISYASSLNESYVYTANNTGAIAGGVVGACIGLALLVLGAYLVYRRRKHSRLPPPPDGEKPYGSEYGVYPAPGQPTYAQLVAQQYTSGVVPYQQPLVTGTAMEPMPAPSPSLSAGPHSPGTPTGEFGARRGTDGLADPNTFVSRSTGSGMVTR